MGRSPKDIERMLGEQYANVIAQAAPADVRQDCKEVITTSLDLMEHAMRVSLTLRAWARNGNRPAHAHARVQAQNTT